MFNKERVVSVYDHFLLLSQIKSSTRPIGSYKYKTSPENWYIKLPNVQNTLFYNLIYHNTIVSGLQTFNLCVDISLSHRPVWRSSIG